MSDVAALDGSLHPPQVGALRSGGLPCRARAARCRISFWPTVDTVAEIQRAGRVRDEHERRVHDYMHQRLEITPPDFTKARRIVALRSEL